MLLDQGAQSCFSGVLAPWPPADCVYSCSVSFLICSNSNSISRSNPRTGRQLRIDNHCRHRGNDEKDSPLLLETDAAAEGGDVAIGGKQSDQAEEQSATGLDGTELIQAWPGALWFW
jgi:hypothetical protein